MREIRDSGKVVGLDRIAVMAALNLANELLKTRGRGDGIAGDLGVRLRRLNDRLEAALSRSPHLEI
jgi:cell division protein ZapA